MQPLLDRLLVMPVFTAHPTEAKRRTMLTKLARRSPTILDRLDFARPGPEEERQAHEELREEIVSLWQTEETRAYKPDVMDEVRNGLFYFETVLHDLAPEVARALERAVAEHYPGARVRPTFLRFGSWMGGDRDGNPFVTTAVTEETLRAHNEVALRLLRRGIERLHGHLSTTERLGVDRELLESLRAGRGAVPRGRAARARSATGDQPYRQKLLYVYRRLGATLEASAAALARRPPRAPGRLRDARATLLADLRLLQCEPAPAPRRAAGRRPAGDARAPGRDLRLPPRDARPAPAQHAPRERPVRGAGALRPRRAASPRRARSSAASC